MNTAADIESSSRPLVSMRGIDKSFGDLQAVQHLDLDIQGGSVLALLGENGAGKTTTMNILAGLYVPDSGEISIEGKPIKLGSPAEAIAAGVGMVHQQFRLVETFTGAENISLALDSGKFWLSSSSTETVQELQDQLGFDLDIEQPVWRLSIAERQQLAILRTIAVGATVLILDEPTSVLAPNEVEGLYEIVRLVADSGRAVVLITHKLLEAQNAADSVCVMRKGSVVYRSEVRIDDLGSVAASIVGDRIIEQSDRPQAELGSPALSVSGLTVIDDHGVISVNDVSFEVRAGEVVALVGVIGNGQSELMEALGGLRVPAAGKFEIQATGPGRGFAYIPSRHLGMGLAPGMSVVDNSILGHHRTSPFRWWLDEDAVEARARDVTSRFAVRASGSGPVSQLSGGNLQRLVLGRELFGDPALILADYPTRGLDVASAAQIRAALVSAASGGAGVLVSSEEWEESLVIANRLLVMHNGRIVADREPDSFGREELGLLMTTGQATA